MQTQKPNFPFSAVTGQQRFKLALTLVAVNPSIGGVLISGPRGSAKSTLAKGLADVMPAVNADTNHVTLTTPTTTAPFVTLPLSVTEEMVVGTLNLQQVLNEKQVAFQNGLLAKADQGILYVDEVNLLPDHIVDLLLDVAASGVSIIERDGISHKHDAKFILLGTMNPDEGELRSQLQDRFGLSVELGNEYDIAERIEIVQRQEAYDTDGHAFLQEYQTQQDTLKNDILATRSRLPNVKCSLEMQELIAKKCSDARVDGLRADIVWYRAALTHAALHQRLEVVKEDINAVEELVLSHRRNSKQGSQGDDSQGSSNSVSSKNSGSNHEPQQKPFSRPKELGSTNKTQQKSGGSGDYGEMDPQQLKTSEPLNFVLPHIDNKRQQYSLNKNSLSHTSKAKCLSGNQLSSRSSSRITDNKRHQSTKVNWLASLLDSAGRWPLQRLMFYQTRKTDTIIHLILIDTSASTLESGLFSQAKGVILNIAEKAYLNREQLSIIGFGNQRVETLLPRQRAPKALRAFLDNIPASGGTPFREALQYAEKYLKQQKKQTPNIRIKMYIVTDGKTRQSFSNIDLGDDVTLIDIEKSAVKRGKGLHIARSLNASYIPLFN